MVGRQHGHHASRRAGADHGRAKRHGGAGVAPDRFSDDVLFRKFRELLADLGRLGFVRDHQDVFGGNKGQDAVNGLLEKRPVAKQGDKLFGCFFAADGPEAFAFATRHDDDKPIFGLRARF